MARNKNVYLVLTEYQFLQAINLATSTYSNKNYSNIIYILRSGRRLMGIDATKEWILDNIQIHILENKTPKEIATVILNETPEHFFIFQGNSALNVFLGDAISRRGVEISLGPDGYGMYSVYKKKHPILTLIKDTYQGNQWLLKNELFKGKIHRFDYYKYGNHKFINNVWVTHPEKYIHQANNKVNILKLPDFNKKCIDSIKKCFDFKDEFPVENAIYYFNQPLWPELLEKEFNFLKGVLKSFPNKCIILKLHPLTSPKVKSMYHEIDRLQIIESTVPAEVMLISLKNCIIFTGWSSVLITENKTCNYYFNYPIYKGNDVKFLNQSELVVLDHITLVDKPELMKFPNE
jgi:hypothetical protein